MLILDFSSYSLGEKETPFWQSQCILQGLTCSSKLPCVTSHFFFFFFLPDRLTFLPKLCSLCFLKSAWSLFSPVTITRSESRTAPLGHGGRTGVQLANLGLVWGPDTQMNILWNPEAVLSAKVKCSYWNRDCKLVHTNNNTLELVKK